MFSLKSGLIIGKMLHFKPAINQINIWVSFGRFQWYILLILCKTRTNASESSAFYILILYINSMFHYESFRGNKSYQHLSCKHLTYIRNYFMHTIFLLKCFIFHSSTSLNEMQKFVVCFFLRENNSMTCWKDNPLHCCSLTTNLVITFISLI